MRFFRSRLFAGSVMIALAIFLFAFAAVRNASADWLVVVEDEDKVLQAYVMVVANPPTIKSLGRVSNGFILDLSNVGGDPPPPPPPSGLAGKIEIAARAANDLANAKELSAQYAAAIQAIREGLDLVPVITILKAGEAVTLDMPAERTAWADYLGLTRAAFRAATRDTVTQIAAGLAAVAPAAVNQGTLDAMRKTAKTPSAKQTLNVLSAISKEQEAKPFKGVTIDVTLVPRNIPHKQSEDFRTHVVESLKSEGATVKVTEARINGNLPRVVLRRGNRSIAYNHATDKRATWMESLKELAERLSTATVLATH